MESQFLFVLVKHTVCVRRQKWHWGLPAGSPGRLDSTPGAILGNSLDYTSLNLGLKNKYSFSFCPSSARHETFCCSEVVWRQFLILASTRTQFHLSPCRAGKHFAQPRATALYIEFFTLYMSGKLV